MKFISKSFPGVNALNNIEFHLYKGEVHALAGENGAGKSVLLKILSGFYQPDTGQILLNGEPIKIDSEESALKLGIAMIHQELNPLLDLALYRSKHVGKNTFQPYTEDLEHKKLDS